MVEPKTVISQRVISLSEVWKIGLPSPTSAAVPIGRTIWQIASCAGVAPEVSTSLSAPSGQCALTAAPISPAVGSSVVAAPSSEARRRRLSTGSMPITSAPIAIANCVASRPTGPRPETAMRSRPPAPRRTSGAKAVPPWQARMLPSR